MEASSAYIVGVEGWCLTLPFTLFGQMAASVISLLNENEFYTYHLGTFVLGPAQLRRSAEGLELGKLNKP